MIYKNRNGESLIILGKTAPNTKIKNYVEDTHGIFCYLCLDDDITSEFKDIPWSIEYNELWTVFYPTDEQVKDFQDFLVTNNFFITG